MSDFRLQVRVAHELVRLADLSSQLECSLLTEDAQIEDEAIILEDEAGELEAADEAIAVRVTHVFVAHDNVVLGGHVVSQVVIHDQA